jgi:hypothetical protein
MPSLAWQDWSARRAVALDEIELLTVRSGARDRDGDT